MDAFARLVSSLGRLPGVGRRSAERIALALVRDPAWGDELTAALQDARRRIRCCPVCGSLSSTQDDACRLCSDSARDDTVICVVEQPHDILLLERSGGYRGRYHALMGRLSGARGEAAVLTRVSNLEERVRGGRVREVILALSTDMEGEATAGLIAERLKVTGVTVTRLAFGLPAGSAVMYSDPVTLGRAIRGRQPVQGADGR